MARPNKIWFRKDIGWWMVTLGGVKTRLAEGKANKQAAQDKFHELALLQSRVPEAPSARVADVIEAFLAWSKIHRSDETNRNYFWYGEKFAEAAGFLLVCELKPIHVTRFVDKHGWTETTERNARRSVYRAFSFLNALGEPWTVNAIRCRINRLKEKTDLPKDVCSYLLRHAFGTNAILNGVDVITVAQLMGHESLDMIHKVYAHLADKHEHLQDALEQARKRPAPAKQPQGEKRRGA
jgi:hypothetical protein